jgi:NAD(P)-dependent dehydrogenase (short-subunit alcohol dehydrogenase family)
MATKYVAIHENPQGPGDARPTAQQIIRDENLEDKLSGKVILITGCSSGLGVETARALFTTGATLFLTARNLKKATDALGDLAVSDRVHLLKLDLNSLASVRHCAGEFLSKSEALNILIANAGVMATPESRTVDGFETQIGTNHLAHFLLFELLKSALLRSTTSDFASRVVILSSVAHRMAKVDFSNLTLSGSYDPWIAYGQSKTAGLWTANEIERRYGERGIHAWSIQPGGVATDLMQHLPEEARSGWKQDDVLSKIFKNPQQGAATSTWAAISKSLEGRGGKYLEDCQVIGAWTAENGQWGPGYAAWAYDEEKAKKLWAISLDLVGL